jgi:integrase
VAAYTGLRLGGLLALRWRDIDYGKRLVHVRRSYVTGQEEMPKSGRVRSVPMTDQVMLVLDGLSKRERFAVEQDLVFANAVGEHFDGSALRRRFYAAIERAAVKRIRFHDLRHTFGTLAVQAFPLTHVKAFMGHADISTTMIYVHHVPQHDAAEKLSAVLRAASSVEFAAPEAKPAAPIDSRSPS